MKIIELLKETSAGEVIKLLSMGAIKVNGLVINSGFIIKSGDIITIGKTKVECWN